MSRRAPNVDEVRAALLRASGTLSAYSAKHKIPLPTTNVLLFGGQSAGKTRLLNTFAGRALGVVLKGTGNRCPVLYQFKTVAKADECCSATWNGKTTNLAPDKVHGYVGTLMKALESSTRFSAQTLVINVALEDALTICVTDMPGVRPPKANGASEDNKLIEEVWRSCAKAQSSVPVIVTQLHEDHDAIESDLETLRAAMGATPEMLRRAVVVVARLDQRHRLHGCVDHMLALQDLLRKKEIGSKERTVFLSLKPECYDSTKPSDAAEPADLDAYYRDIRRVDKEMMDQHLSPSIRHKFRVGIAAAVETITDSVIAHFSSHASVALGELHKQFEVEAGAARASVDMQDPKRLRRDAQEYVSLFCAHLASQARWDISGFVSTLKGLRGRQSAERMLPHHLAMTFEEEIAALGVGDSTFVQEYRQLLSLMTKRLRSQLDRKLYGGSSLLRLLRVWTFVVLKRPVREFTVEEMQRMGSMSDMDCVRGWSIDWCLRKMIEENCFFVQTTASEVSTWTRRLFSSHAQVATEAVAEFTPLLQEVPELRKQLSDQMSAYYDQYLGRQVTKAEQTISTNIEAHFESLKPDAPFAMLRLICSIRVPDDLFSSLGGTPKRTQSALTAAVTGALQSISGLDRSVLEFVSDATALSRGNAHVAVTDLFRMCSRLSNVVTTEEFALGEGIKLPRVLDTELEDKKGHINELVKALTYLHNGIILISAVNAFDRDVEQPVKQLDRLIFADLTRVLTRFSDSELLALVLGDAAERLARIDSLQVALVDNHTAQTEVLSACRALGQCPMNGTPTHVFESVSRLLADARKKIAGAAPPPASGSSPSLVKDVRHVAEECDKETAAEVTAEQLLQRESEIASLRCALKDLERELLTLRNGSSGSTLSPLVSNELLSARSLVKSWRARAQTLQRKHERSVRMLGNRRTARQAGKAIADAAEASRAKLEPDVVRLSGEVAQLSRDREAALRRATAAEGELASARSDVSNLRTQLAASQQSVTNLTAAVAAAAATPAPAPATRAPAPATPAPAPATPAPATPAPAPATPAPAPAA